MRPSSSSPQWLCGDMPAMDGQWWSSRIVRVRPTENSTSTSSTRSLWVQLALRVNFGKLLLFHLFFQCSHFISAIVFVSRHICLSEISCRYIYGIKNYVLKNASTIIKRNFIKNKSHHPRNWKTAIREELVIV